MKERLRSAARALGAADPVPVVGPLVERSFTLPPGSAAYSSGRDLVNGAPFEPTFSEENASALRFSILPLGPNVSPIARQQEATREMRGFVAPWFGNDALRWFDRRSEEWRGTTAHGRALVGARFAPSFDRGGLSAARVIYELHPNQLGSLVGPVATLAKIAVDTVPSLVPLTTSIQCARGEGCQQVTFLHKGTLRLADLGVLMTRLGLSHQLPSIMRLIGLVLGGRFELPEKSVLLSLRETPEGPEVRLDVLLNRVPDVPVEFLDLLALGLSERPRELHALGRWLHAFSPGEGTSPGALSMLSVGATANTPGRVELNLRPYDFEGRRISGNGEKLS